VFDLFMYLCLDIFKHINDSEALQIEPIASHTAAVTRYQRKLVYSRRPRPYRACRVAMSQPVATGPCMRDVILTEAGLSGAGETDLPNSVYKRLNASSPTPSESSQPKPLHCSANSAPLSSSEK
jgi:hypothetical protein